MQQLAFEQGPIRPPSEARSLLLRITRNCSWNKCIFCSVYKNNKFERRTTADVKADIDKVVEMIGTVNNRSVELGLSGKVTGQVANYFLEQPDIDHSFASVVAWLYYGTKAVFLQDANSLIMKADNLVELLNYLNSRISDISRITTYSRSQTIARKSIDDLKRIREAGLNRVHVGLETGSEAVLKLMNKGVKPGGHIKGGRNVIDAGMELSEYYMPGLGGKKLWKEHSTETAEVLNEINPHFIRLRTLHVGRNLPLYGLIESGEFELRTPDEVVEEIRLFIEKLDGITSYLASDHIGNMLQDVEGRLPQDKPKMLEALDRYLNLDPEQRLHYQIGRVMGVYGSVLDMAQPGTHQQVEEVLDKLKEKYKGNLNEVLIEIHDKVMR